MRSFSLAVHGQPRNVRFAAESMLKLLLPMLGNRWGMGEAATSDVVILDAETLGEMNRAGTVRPDALYKIAKTSGMSRAQFDKCLSNQSIIDGLTEVKQRGRKYGVVGTPTFFINGQKLQGEVTFEEMKALIEPQAS